MLTDETAAVEEDETLLGKGGLPDNITLPGPPTDWKPPSIKVEKGEPHFESVDNAGSIQTSATFVARICIINAKCVEFRYI